MSWPPLWAENVIFLTRREIACELCRPESRTAWRRRFWRRGDTCFDRVGKTNPRRKRFYRRVDVTHANSFISYLYILLMPSWHHTTSAIANLFGRTECIREHLFLYNDCVYRVRRGYRRQTKKIKNVCPLFAAHNIQSFDRLDMTIHHRTYIYTGRAMTV